MRILLILFALIVIAGCCAGGSDYLTLSVGETRANTTIRWGGTMQFTDPTFDASWPRAGDVRGEPLEFYEDGERVDVPAERFEVNNQLDNGCGWSDHIEYRLGAIGAGTYTVVHRRESGTGDRVSCGGSCPWTEFDGSEALVVTVVVGGGAAAADAGADAGLDAALDVIDPDASDGAEGDADADGVDAAENDGDDDTDSDDGDAVDAEAVDVDASSDA